jgi:four helix bundle protein
MKENILLTKSYSFSVRIVKLFQHLIEKHKIYDLARQVLRSGTSIGANCEEAMGGFSPKDFRHKITIAYKEARETRYWLRLLRDTGYIDTKLAKSLITDAEELLKILGKIIITMNKKLKKHSEK